jgi:hypothetical protein
MPICEFLPHLPEIAKLKHYKDLRPNLKPGKRQASGKGPDADLPISQHVLPIPIK